MKNRRESLTGELVLRYACATMVTWLALAGAQLIVRTDFILVLAWITLLGVPVSLGLRLNRMRVGRVEISRPLWNGFTVLLSFGAASLWTLNVLRDMIGLLTSGASQTFWLRFGAGESLALLMQIFLLFAAFRSFALISDKDATLTTVPSFSVLLLLIPSHKGLEVVIYFVLWTFVATVLFALDHRSEMREMVAARVEAPLPGQDVRLAARSLGTILSLALFVAMALSYFLTFRSPDSRSTTESAISELAARLTQFALAMPDGSINTGPERQIDFSSSPSIPSRAILWRAQTFTLDGQSLQPEYWRLFTLANYSGASWTQKVGGQRTARRQSLTREQWPRFNRSTGRERDERGRNFESRQPSFGFEGRGNFRQGFDLSAAFPQTRTTYGKPTRQVRQIITARAPNLGFVPLLAGAVTLRLPGNDLEVVRVRDDGAVDISVVEGGQAVACLSQLPVLTEYGLAGHPVPTKKVRPQKSSPRLSPALRALYVGLPPNVTSRVGNWAKSALKSAPTSENNLARARRLALEMQKGAVYTLRPPAVPEGRDAADFFLFEGNRRGYCTYFAGALTVACRTQNIPARVVSGFASPEWESASTAVLREANAHAWTEVWVDNWGWATVDATPATNRGENAPNWIENWRDWTGFAVNEARGWLHTHLVWAVFTLSLTLLGVQIWLRRHRLSLLWWGRSPLSRDVSQQRRALIRAYERAARQLARRFRSRHAPETPDEWLQSARAHLPNVPEEFADLTRAYNLALYAPALPEESRVAQILQSAENLRWKRRAR